MASTENLRITSVVKSTYWPPTKSDDNLSVVSLCKRLSANNIPVTYCELIFGEISKASPLSFPLIVRGRKFSSIVHFTPCSGSNFRYSSSGRKGNLPSPTNVTLSPKAAQIGIITLKVVPLSLQLSVKCSVAFSCTKFVASRYNVLPLRLNFAPKASKQPMVASISFDSLTFFI